MKTIKVRTSYVPDDCSYLTPGKVYTARQIWETDPDLYRITDDDFDGISVRVSGCAFLDGEAWEVVDE